MSPRKETGVEPKAVVDQEGSQGGGVITRRDLVRAGVGTAAGAAVSGGLLSRALEAMAAPAVPGAGPYGPLGSPDGNGVRLPEGFTSRLIARAGQPIGPRPYTFHTLPDGMGTYRTKDGGFILVSNSEAPDLPPIWTIGTAAIRFDRDFEVTDAYPILEGTSINCAGGTTPWNTWLSCEEFDRGQVFECDPFGEKEAIVHPAMGVFKHEASVIDPVGRQAFLTEDLGDGCFYRFVPDRYPDLSKGRLEVAVVDSDGKVEWVEVPDPEYTGSVPTRKQVPEATTFKRGEGAWYDDGVVYFATTQDDRVYAYHCASEVLEVLYDGVALGEEAPLHDTDNVTVSPVSGDLYVAEDAGEHQICIISTEGQAAPFLQLPGPEHASSELTGPVFDPTGNRLYFSSQRATGGGIVFEISGPFRRTRGEPVFDTAAPVTRIRTLGKPGLRGLIKSGQGFAISVSDLSYPVEAEARLVTKLKRAAGKGAGEVTLARVPLRFERPGEKVVRLTPAGRYGSRLRRLRGVRARLVVETTDLKGNRSATVKQVRFD
jgi:secreted PhoX family phosphatase